MTTGDLLQSSNHEPPPAQRPLHVIPQTLQRSQDRSQIPRRWTGQIARLIGDPSNLIEVTPYHPELTHGSFEFEQLPLWQRSQSPEVCAQQHRHVGGHRNTAARRPLAQ